MRVGLLLGDVPVFFVVGVNRVHSETMQDTRCGLHGKSPEKWRLAVKTCIPVRLFCEIKLTHVLNANSIFFFFTTVIKKALFYQERMPV